MYTRFLRRLIKMVNDNRNGHCSGDGEKGGGSGHCS